jgi:hypothetical protein
MRFMIGIALAAGLWILPGFVAAQQAPEPLAVGTVAPDFAVTGATRYGVLARPVHLTDFKGKTVVITFFFKARTKG